MIRSQPGPRLPNPDSKNTLVKPSPAIPFVNVDFYKAPSSAGLALGSDQVTGISWQNSCEAEPPGGE